MIDKDKCYSYLTKLNNIKFNDLCEQGVSIGDLFLDEIPTYGSCTKEDAMNYIQEESAQMAAHLGVEKYDMFNISVPEHVYNEDKLEPEHAHLLYAPVPGPVKFFQEWLEGHHPSLGCMYKMSNQVPPDEYYEALIKAREEAKRYRHD
jgi:hypothetical protein